MKLIKIILLAAYFAVVFSIKVFAASSAVATFTATLSRPSPSGGGGGGAIWASAGALPFLGFQPPTITGFAAPKTCYYINPPSNNCSKPRYRIALIRENTETSNEIIKKALNNEKQPNIIVYEFILNSSFRLINPTLIKSSFDEKLDKKGKYSATVIYTYVLGL